MSWGPARWKMLGFRRSALADQRGVALIEFALVLPMILLILLGMIDVGKAVNYWNDETHLANEADSAELRNGGTGSVSSPGVQICIWFPNNTNSADDPARDHAIGDPVQVIVHAQYNWLAYLVGKGLPVHSDLSASSTMRLEQTYRANGSDAFTTGPASAPKQDASGTC